MPVPIMMRNDTAGTIAIGGQAAPRMDLRRNNNIMSIKKDGGAGSRRALYLDSSDDDDDDDDIMTGVRTEKLNLSNKCLDMLMNDLVLPEKSASLTTSRSGGMKRTNSGSKRRGWGHRKNKSTPDVYRDILNDSDAESSLGGEYEVPLADDTTNTNTTKTRPNLSMGSKSFSLRSAGGAVKFAGGAVKSLSSSSLQHLQGTTKAVLTSTVMVKFFNNNCSGESSDATTTTKKSRSDGDLKETLRRSASCNASDRRVHPIASETGSRNHSFKKSSSGSSLRRHGSGGGGTAGSSMSTKNSSKQHPASISSLQNAPIQLLLSESRRHVEGVTAVRTPSCVGVAVTQEEVVDNDKKYGDANDTAQSSLLSKQDRLNASRGRGWSSNHGAKRSNSAGRSSARSRREQLWQPQNRPRSSRELRVGSETVLGGGVSRSSRSSSGRRLGSTASEAPGDLKSSSYHQPRRGLKESYSRSSSSSKIKSTRRMSGGGGRPRSAERNPLDSSRRRPRSKERNLLDASSRPRSKERNPLDSSTRRPRSAERNPLESSTATRTRYTSSTVGTTNAGGGHKSSTANHNQTRRKRRSRSPAKRSSSAAGRSTSRGASSTRGRSSESLRKVSSISATSATTSSTANAASSETTTTRQRDHPRRQLLSRSKKNGRSRSRTRPSGARKEKSMRNIKIFTEDTDDEEEPVHAWAHLLDMNASYSSV